MPRVGLWRSAWPWHCPQRRVKRSRLDGGRHPAVHIGEKGGDGVGVPGVIAGGVHMAAGAAGGNGAHGRTQTCSIRMPRHPRNRARSAVGLHPIRSPTESVCRLDHVGGQLPDPGGIANQYPIHSKTNSRGPADHQFNNSAKFHCDGDRCRTFGSTSLASNSSERRQASASST